MECGAIPMFVALLDSPQLDVSEQAVWALGNIAGDGADMRERVIRDGALPPLIALVYKRTEVAFLRNVTWSLSNICRNKDPSPHISVIQQCLVPIVALMQHEDVEIQGNS